MDLTLQPHNLQNSRQLFDLFSTNVHKIVGYNCVKNHTSQTNQYFAPSLDVPQSFCNFFAIFMRPYVVKLTTTFLNFFQEVRRHIVLSPCAISSDISYNKGVPRGAPWLPRDIYGQFLTKPVFPPFLHLNFFQSS